MSRLASTQPQLHISKWAAGTLWGPSPPYKPTQWAHLAEVGFLGCVDGTICREIGGGEAEEVKDHPPPPLQAPRAPRKATVAKPPSGRPGIASSPTLAPSPNTPASSSSSSSGKDSPPKNKKPPSQKRRAVPAPKEKGGKKEEEGGGGAPNNPLVGTTTHVPYGGWVEVGTVTGALALKSGVVWVRYRNNPKLYEVERHLVLGTAQAAEAHLQKMRKGKTPTTNPPHPQRSPLTPRITPKKTLNPTKIPPLTHLTPHPQPKVLRYYGTQNRAPERCNTSTMARMAKNVSREG